MCSRLNILLVALALVLPTINAFSAVPPVRRRPAGGRAPQVPDKIPEPDDQSSETRWEASPCGPSESKLIVLQVTDVYTLENFASFKTLLEETRAKAEGAKVVCMLTGDFLSPYLLSGVDRGAGMMRALTNVPMDYLTWGNHEADIPHSTGMFCMSWVLFDEATPSSSHLLLLTILP